MTLPDRLPTADGSASLPGDGLRHELAGGLLVPAPPAFFHHGQVAAEVHAILVEFVRPRGLRRVLSADTGSLGFAVQVGRLFSD